MKLFYALVTLFCLLTAAPGTAQADGFSMASVMDAHQNIYAIKTFEDFQTKVLEASQSRRVYVYVDADWCGYCKIMTPVFVDEFLKAFGDKANLAVIDLSNRDPQMMTLAAHLPDFGGTPHGNLYVRGKPDSQAIFMIGSVLKAPNAQAAERILRDYISTYFHRKV